MKRHGSTKGDRRVVVVGNGMVGHSFCERLVGRDATVTVCHSKTRSIEEVCRRADILVAAIGRARFVKGSWIKAGATVIDVGTNVVDDPVYLQLPFMTALHFKKEADLAKWDPSPCDARF